MLSAFTNKKKEAHCACNITILVWAVVLLVVGGMLYMAFRALSLRMFGWCDTLGVMDFVNQIRALCKDIHPGHFVLYNLPDLLWIVSYLLFVNAIIPKTDRTAYIFWLCLMPGLAIGHEIMQAMGFANGSFDLVDLLCYLMPLIINIIIINLTHFFYEKNL